MNYYHIVLVFMLFRIDSILYGMVPAENKSSKLSVPVALAIVHPCACRQSFSNKMQLLQHAINEHFIKAPEGDYYVCPAQVCCEYVKTLPGFMQHMQTHTSVAPSGQLFQAAEPEQALVRQEVQASEKNSLSEKERKTSLAQTLINSSSSLFVSESNSVAHAHEQVGFECACDQKFINEDGLKEHIIRSHCQGSQYICPKCSKSIAGLVTFIGHMDIHSINDKCYTCPVQGCLKVFSSIRERQAHVKKKHEKSNVLVGNFLCRKCGCRFWQKTYLEEHFFSAHKQCFTCNETFSTSEEMQSHEHYKGNSRISSEKRKREETSYSDSDQGTKELSYTMHIQEQPATHIQQAEIGAAEEVIVGSKRKADALSSDEQDIHKASLIQTLMQSSRSLQILNSNSSPKEQDGLEQKISSDENQNEIKKPGIRKFKINKFDCVCGEKFKYEENLKRHIVGFHKQASGYTCPACEAHFKGRPIKLLYHLDRHRSNVSYACDWDSCSKVFSSLRQMRDHLNTHKSNNVKRKKKRPIISSELSQNVSAKEMTKDVISNTDLGFVDWLNDPAQDMNALYNFQSANNFSDVLNINMQDRVSSPAKTEQDETEIIATSDDVLQFLGEKDS